MCGSEFAPYCERSYNRGAVEQRLNATSVKWNDYLPKFLNVFWKIVTEFRVNPANDKFVCIEFVFEIFRNFVFNKQLFFGIRIVYLYNL